MLGADSLRYRKVTYAELEELRRLPTREIFKALGIPRWRIPRLAAHLRRRAAEESSRMQLFPGMVDLLTTLHGNGVTLAIATSNSETTVRHVLGERLAAMIHLYACNAAVFGKAAKFKRIMRKAGVAPSETVAIGDETRDLEAARAAGIRGLAVEWGYADATLLRAAAPGRTASSVSDLTDMLGQ